MKKAQTLSTEFIIAITIFVAAIILFITLLSSSADPKTKELQQEAVLLSDQTKVDESPINIVTDGDINRTKLRMLIDTPYEELKQELGLQNEFCIYFKDRQGKVMYITGPDEQDRFGIGSSKIYIDEKECGQSQ